MNKIVIFSTIFAAMTLTTSVFGQEQPTVAPNEVVGGIRQGLWRVERANGKIDEGIYVDGKKEGEWKVFNSDGSLRSITTYVNGVPKGKASIYGDSGALLEEGYWNVGHWEGEYTRYYETGVPACKFNYDKAGRRAGEQMYYHSNGEVMYKGNWLGGRIVGTLEAYDMNGNKILERNYDADGKFTTSVEITVDAKSTELPRVFTGTGNFTLYNTKDPTLIDQKGYFVKGVLMDGEKYVYKEDGVTLDHIVVYAGGKVVKTNVSIRK